MTLAKAPSTPRKLQVKVCPLSLWERAGVRDKNTTTALFITPHPDLLPQGEGTLL
jgi:hypothetical protein